MTDSKPLSKKHATFVDEYLKCFNATQAYLLVYPNSTYEAARANAARLIAKDNISEAIQDRLAEVHMSADEVLKRLADIARGDVADVLDITSMGYSVDMKKAHEAGVTKLIKKVKQKTITINGKNEDKEIHFEEVELYSAKDALELIGKHHRLFAERLEVDHTLRIEGLEKSLEKIYGKK